MRLNRHAYKKGSAANGDPRYGWRLERRRGYPWWGARVITKALSFVLQKDVRYRSIGGEVSYDCGKRHSGSWQQGRHLTFRENHRTRSERNRRRNRELWNE